jgi:hypothetical protein
MRPENALSPRKRLDASSLDVIYRSPVNERGRSWSLAKMTWDGVPDRVGCRWDGVRDDAEDKGNPRSHGQGTWFILPDEIGRPIAHLLAGLRQVIEREQRERTEREGK